MTLYAVRCNFGKYSVNDERFETIIKNIRELMELYNGVVMEGETPLSPWFYALFKSKKVSIAFAKALRARNALLNGKLGVRYMAEPVIIDDSHFTKAFLDTQASA